MKLNKRELATVLHSLRVTQEFIRTGTDISSCIHFSRDKIKPLTFDEIDDLCEQLNTWEESTRLYRVTITFLATKKTIVKYVVRASLPNQAKQIAVDVLCEGWPRNNSLRGTKVELSVDELIEPENGGTGYCYPKEQAHRVFRHTFK